MFKESIVSFGGVFGAPGAAGSARQREGSLGLQARLTDRGGTPNQVAHVKDLRVGASGVQMIFLIAWGSEIHLDIEMWDNVEAPADSTLGVTPSENARLPSCSIR
jgi:hypothetical protein